MEPESTELTPEVYAHLRRLAGRIFAERGRGHASIQPTILLHEAWAKVSTSSTRYESRAHFMAVAARAMRQILIDRARNQQAAKRGAGAEHVTLAGIASDTQPNVDVLALDHALDQLTAFDATAARVVELRIFGGMTLDEVADVLGVSSSSASRTWEFARLFLLRRLQD